MLFSALLSVVIFVAGFAFADDERHYQQQSSGLDSKLDDDYLYNRGMPGGGGMGLGGFGGGGMGGGFGRGRGPGFGGGGPGFRPGAGPGFGPGPGYLAQAPLPPDDEGIDYGADAARRQRLAQPFGVAPSIWNPFSWIDFLRKNPSTTNPPTTPVAPPSPSPTAPPPPTDPGGSGSAVGGGSPG